MNKPGRAEPSDWPLAPISVPNTLWSADPHLTARLQRFAAASGIVPLHVIPSAAVLLLPLHLPLKSARKRRAALPFVLEPHLAAPVEDTQVALGPSLGGDHWLCAAVDRAVLQDLLVGADAQGTVLPDILAVPRPDGPAAWSLWFSERAAYIRLADGGGLSVAIDAFADLWRAQRRPAIELVFGHPPPGVQISTTRAPLPEVDPSVFALDLRPGPGRGAEAARWQRRLRFAGAVLAVALFGQTALLHLDARALAQMTTARAEDLRTQLSARGLSLDLSLPTQALANGVVRAGTTRTSHDLLLVQFVHVADAMSSGTARLRDLRFDRAAGRMTLLLTGNDLAELQQVARDLKARGLGITSGPATQTDSGAELQLFVSQPT